MLGFHVLPDRSWRGEFGIEIRFDGGGDSDSGELGPWHRAELGCLYGHLLSGGSLLAPDWDPLGGDGAGVKDLDSVRDWSADDARDARHDDDGLH